MHETVVVQVLAGGVVLAKARRAGETAALSELVHQPVGPGESAQQVALGLVRKTDARNIGLALLVNWDLYSLRDVWLPFSAPAQIRETIKFELEDDLDIAADDLLMPFEVLEQRPEASHVLAWAAKKEAIADLLKTWEGAGLSPEYMPPDAVGHIGLVEHLAADLIDQPLVVVCGAERWVDLTLVAERRIWARRRLLDCAWATEAAGGPLQETRRTFLSVPSFPTPQAVVSFGGEAADTLARVIAKDLGCPHRSIAPPAVPGEAKLLYWPLAAGVALMMAGQGARPLSFRIEDFEPKESGQTASLLALVATALLAVVLLVGGFICHLNTATALQEIGGAEADLAAYWQAQSLPQSQLPSFATLEGTLNKQIADTEQQLAEAKKRPDAIKRFRSLALAMASLPEGITLDLAKVDILADAIVLAGTANSYEATTDLSNHINKTKEFNAAYDAITPQASGTAKFVLRVKYSDVKQEGRS